MTRDARSPAEPQDPDPRALAVAPVAIRDPGGGRRSALLGLVGVAAVLGIAIGAATLLPSSPASTEMGTRAAGARATASAPGSDASPSSSPSPTPGPEMTLPPAIVFYNAHELGEQVAGGSLDGRLVLVLGKLEAIALPCDREPDALHSCVLLAIEGVDLPVQAGTVALPWHDDPPSGDLLVVMPSRGKLVYLGHLPPASRSPRLIDVLTRDLLLQQGASGPPAEMFLVDGWLVPRPPSSCPVTTDPSASPCWIPGPFLADDEPAADGSPRSRRGSNVVVGDAVGIDPEATVTRGPFLVTMLTREQCATAALAPACAGTGPRWVVEAAYRNVVLAEEPRAGAAATGPMVRIAP